MVIAVVDTVCLFFIPHYIIISEEEFGVTPSSQLTLVVSSEELMKTIKLLSPLKTVVIFCLLTGLLFILSKTMLIDNLTSDPLLMVSQACSLIGMTVFAFSFVFTIRTKFIEDWCGGLDKAYKLHHNLGILSFILLVNHPLFLIIRGFNLQLHQTVYLFPGSMPAYNFGIISLYLLILFIILTIFIKLPYHVWKFTHKFTGIAFIFGYAHLLTIHSDVSRSALLFYWMAFVSIIGLLSYLYRELISSLIRSRSKYQIAQITDFGDLIELTLSPVDQPINPLPGQYVFIKFLGSNKVAPEEHPFSIASGSNDHKLKFLIKKSGDYTKNLAELQEGGFANLSQPYGKFYDFIKSRDKVVLIAGGIGITPFLGILASNLPKNYYLFHTVRELQSAFYAGKTKEFAHPNTRLKHVLHSNDLQGKLSGQKIMEQIGNTDNTVFLLCGPKNMMADITKQLVDAGIDKNLILSEDFNIK